MNFFLHLPHGCPSRRRTAVPTPSIYRRSTATWAPIPWPLLPVDLAEGEGASATTSVARPPPLLLPPGCRFRFSRELERHRERREWIRMCETSTAASDPGSNPARRTTTRITRPPPTRDPPRVQDLDIPDPPRLTGHSQPTNLQSRSTGPTRRRHVAGRVVFFTRGPLPCWGILNRLPPLPAIASPRLLLLPLPRQLRLLPNSTAPRVRRDLGALCP
ncbi:hypothetical protein DAI22_01g175866 [Oryza sativa Japonica Group]|nr:hypothetical protein DAI22_01g175866 [Oryza sativa Japonica Group]